MTEDIILKFLIQENTKNRERLNEEKNKIKEKYGCKNSEILDFNPQYEHLEKTEYKNHICYVKIENK